MRLPEGRPSKRPIPKRMTVAELGELLDVEIVGPEDDYRARPKGRTALLWAPEQKAALWWPGRTFELEEATPETKAEKRAARVFETWSVWEAGGIGRERLSGGSSFIRYDAHRIGYRSDKFGPLDDFDHRITSRVYVYRPVRAAGPWILRGGKLRVTRRGLEG